MKPQKDSYININHTNTDLYQHCTLCPRACGVNRHTQKGFCGCGDEIKAARAALHFWEEPCISGSGGSGTIFFSGCTLKCCFCQNYTISQENFGETISSGHLAEIMLRLQEQGAKNISLVTATQYLPSILPVLDSVRPKLHIPIVYNCGGYESLDTLHMLEGYVDIYLPDLKYFSPELSQAYSKAGDYFAQASLAIPEMIRQTGVPVLDENGLLRRGTLIRHMVLPNQRKDSVKVLHWMADTLPKDSFLLSLLSQYTPFYHAKNHPEINRRVTMYEYQKVLDEALSLGLTQGFMQERSSAREEYTPPFDLEGIR